MLVSFTNIKGRPFYVNPDHISALYPSVDVDSTWVLHVDDLEFEIPTSTADDFIKREYDNDNDNNGDWMKVLTTMMPYFLSTQGK